jgi:heterotetrameric sarcosine oxidase gamma subunit
MAKKHNLPLGGLNSDGQAVSVSEIALGNLTQLAGWQTFANATDAVLKTQGLSLPADYRSPVHGAGMTVWRIAPDRVLLRSETPVEMSVPEDLVTLDLSDARVCLILEGEGAAGLLGRVIALDFSEAAFPAGTFVQTSLHHVGVLVERLERDRFLVMVPTTWERSLTDLLVTHLTVAA